jgi:cytochrome c peroxidase
MERIAQVLENTSKAPTPSGPTVSVPGATPAPAATPAKSSLDPKLVAQGQKLFFDEDNFGCTDCHAMEGKGRAKNGDLSHQGSKQPDIEWQIAHLKAPSSKVPGSKMPPYNDKTPDELRALATFLVSKK